MSVLLGSWRYSGPSAKLCETESLGAATKRFAPDAQHFTVSGSVLLGQQLYATHRRSASSLQAAQNSEGDLISFAGRLDNYRELSGLFGVPPEDVSDALLVSKAFERWGEECFSQLIGEWSLALWCSKTQRMYLAKDHAGTRSLFYQLRPDGMMWSSYLETFVAQRDLRLNLDYAVRYLTCSPIDDATPYQSLHEVPAGAYVRFANGASTVVSYWTPVVHERIQYRTDGEYEQQFFSLFQQAVERRAAPEDLILAELSGGMDSSSIVCMSDHARRARFGSNTSLVDTLSYFDDGEPNWNERPFFTAVERARNRSGIHIASNYQRRDFSLPDAGYLLPGVDGSVLEQERSFEEAIGRSEKRVIVSGFGGDEMLGGPSNPLPTLGDAMVEHRWKELFDALVPWCIAERTTMFDMTAEVIKVAHTRPWSKQGAQSQKIPWLPKKTLLNARHDGRRSQLLGALPSTSDNALIWRNMMGSLPHRLPNLITRREYRYPILDRQLVEFLLRVPPDQMRRPGERRSLMRRAFKNILPPDVLGRTQKASLQRGPIRLLEEKRELIPSLFKSSILEDLGLLNGKALRTAIEYSNFKALAQQRRHLMRAIHLEIWLRRRRSESGIASMDPHESVHLKPNIVSA